MITVPSPHSKKRARIEIIPLIDIIFFLLATFIMVSLSMVKNQGLAVTLPAASTGAPQERTDFATVTVDAAGDIFFNKQSASDEQLKAALKNLLSKNSDPRVFINGDAKAQFGRVVFVLDAARGLGITKVTIETQPKSPP